MVSSNLTFCCPFSFCLRSFPASGSFPSVSSSHQVAKVLELQLQHQSFQWIFRTDFLRIDPFDLGFQQTLSLLQHNSKASILWCSAFSMVQLSNPYMTTGKTIALTRQTFVSKVMSLLFNTLSRFVIVLLPRSKCLNFMASVTICSDFGAKENKVCHCFHCFPIYLPWSDGTRCHDLSFFLILSFKPAFSLSSFTFIKKLYSSSSLSTTRVVSSAYLGY